jgi:hypothetical protein
MKEPQQPAPASSFQWSKILTHPVTVVFALWAFVPLGIGLFLLNPVIRKDGRWWAGICACLALLYVTGRWSDPRPIYSSLEDDYEAIFESGRSQLMKDNGVTEIDKVPSAAREAAFQQLKKDVNSLFAERKPPKVTIEDNVAAKIELLSVGAPEYGNNALIGPHWDIPLKLLAKTSIRRYSTGLRYKVYAPDNTLLEEGGIGLDVDGSPGETVIGNIYGIPKTEFFRMHRVAVVAE